MTKKILIFLIIVQVINLKLTASDSRGFLLIEDITYESENSSIKFPYFTSKTQEKQLVANQINKRLQNILFYDDIIITNDNLSRIEKHIFIRNDSVNQSGISSLRYRYKLHPNFIKIIIDIDWSGGPYPMGAKTDYLHFDLEKGELILMPDLFDGLKYFNFLERFWLDDCRPSIKEMHQCAHGNDTGNYESDSAYTLDGECEFQCHKLNHRFILMQDSIFISNNHNCFPHVSQNCNYGSSKYLRIDEIEDYLSDFGKWILGINPSYCDVRPYLHFVGKIDEKYKISMTISKSYDTYVIGSYFYWRHNKEIILNGKIDNDSERLIMDEFVNDTKTGRFELEWDDFLYSTKGVWYKSSTKKLPVELINIYDYSAKDYN